MRSKWNGRKRIIWAFIIWEMFLGVRVERIYSLYTYELFYCIAYIHMCVKCELHCLLLLLLFVIHSLVLQLSLYYDYYYYCYHYNKIQFYLWLILIYSLLLIAFPIFSCGLTYPSDKRKCSDTPSLSIILFIFMFFVFFSVLFFFSSYSLLRSFYVQ